MRASAGLIVLLLGTGCEAVYRPTAPSADWIAYDSSRYTLYARPGSFCGGEAAQLVDVLEDQYTHATGILGLTPGGRISMFLYNNGNEVNPPLGGPRSGVAFPETNAVHAVCTPPNDGGLWSLLSHEANHVIMQNGLGRAGTNFMNEGLASALVSDARAPIGPTFARGWARANRTRLPRIPDLADDGKWSSSSNDGYNTAAAFLGYLLDRYGAERLKQIYHAHSSDIGGRVQEIYGKSLDALEAEWLSSL